MDKAKIMGVVRHAVGAIGGFLVGMGYADAETVGQVVQSVEAIVGAVGVLIAGAASIVAKLRG